MTSLRTHRRDERARRRFDPIAITLGVALVAGVLGLPLVSQAAPDHDGEIDRWVYAGGLEVGIIGHTGYGRTTASDISGPRVPNPRPVFGDVDGDQILDTDSSREEIDSALVGGTFEVMSPAMLESFGRPRAFVDLNISAVFTTEVGLARDAEPGEMGLPSPIVEAQIIGENAIVGRGNKVTVQHQGPQIHAGIGTAFTFDIGTERIRIKPSLVYSRIITDITGVGNRAVRLNDLTADLRTFENTYRTIELQDQRTEVYHGMGPALEIEYETGERIGPFRIALFLKGHATHLFGDLKTRMQQSNPDYPDETISWKYSQDTWVYRGSTGIRFRWVPKSKRGG